MSRNCRYFRGCSELRAAGPPHQHALHLCIPATPTHHLHQVRRLYPLCRKCYRFGCARTSNHKILGAERWLHPFLVEQGTGYFLSFDQTSLSEECCSLRTSVWIQVEDFSICPGDIVGSDEMSSFWHVSGVELDPYLWIPFDCDCACCLGARASSCFLF